MEDPRNAEVDVYDGLISAGLDHHQAFRTTQAIRELAGRNNSEKLETHLGQFAAIVAGLETRLTAEIKGLETRLTAEIEGLGAGLTAEIEGLGAGLTVKVARLETILTAMQSEFKVHRWLLGAVLGILLFLAGHILAP